MPKVTVIIPSYNHAKFIGEAIQSVLDQTFQDFEILIRDDGSKDNSIEIIKQFTDSRIKFAANPHNMGACYTANTMIEEASGEYIALLNSDDVWMLDKLDKQVKFLDKNPQYGAVFSDAQVIYEDGRDFDKPDHFYNSVFKQANRTRVEWLKYFFEVGNCICHPSMLIRKAVYHDVGLYNRLMASLPDFEMWIRVCARYEIYIMPEKTIKFRILDNEQNASGYNPANLIRGTFENAKLFDAFCLIDNIEIFNQVFSNSEVSDIRQIPFVIAKLLLDDQRIFAVYWSINKIYQLLNDDYNYYSQFMTDVEFTKLAASKDIYDIYGARGAVVHLFYDNGLDFNGEQYSQQNVVVGKNSYYFNLEDLCGITRLRLDPINQPAKVKLLSAHAQLDNDENYPLELVWHNADLNADVYDFKHDDPQMVFNIPVDIQARLLSVEFMVDITPYNKWEILALLRNAYHSGYILATDSKYPENSHMQLFYYQHDEINVPDVRTLYFADANQNKFSFTLDNISDLTHIRIDLTNFPVVANLEYVKLILADGIEHLLQPCYSNANLIDGNSYTYLHDDPINVYYLANLDIGLQKVVIEIAVDLQPIKRSESLAVANQITAKQNEKIIQLESTFHQTQQQLQQAEQQVHQLNRNRRRFLRFKVSY